MRNYTIFFVLILSIQSSFAQDSSDTTRPQRLRFFEPAPRFHKLRFGLLTGGLLAGYTAVTIGLDRAWYAGYPRGKFHFFNDWKGWGQMDKMGHAMTTYFESKWVGDFYHWAGVPRKKALWIGFGAGMLFQTTLEMLDGFSDQWGFSWGDMGFNTIGAALYAGQELAWNEQRIRLKLSVHRPRYSDAPITASNNPAATSSLSERAADLYGTSYPELFFKEYNGQTIWASINPASFCRKKPRWLPEWLNIALGYGIENYYGAERNTWKDADGNTFSAPSNYRRYSQFYLSFDVDFERIPVRQRGWRFLFGFLNVFKVPFPALEVNTLGKVRFHPWHF